MDDSNWQDISRKLREPFDPAEVEWRIQGSANEQTGKAQVVAYVDARTVQDRLDAVVGAGAWSFDWQPLNLDAKGEVTTAKGILTIHGVSKADVGTASNFEATKGCVSECFKRAAVQWGIGRYLYDVPSAWVTVEKRGRTPVIPDATLRDLRARLAKRKPTADAQPTEPAQPTPQEHREVQRGKWDYMADVTFRNYIAERGYESIGDVEALVAEACGGAEPSKDLVKQELLRRANLQGLKTRGA